MKSRFGLHIRLHESLFDAVAKAERLHQRFFQTVLMLQSRNFLNMTEEQIQQFIAIRRQKFDQLFVHAAYWSNITDIQSRGFYSLQKEIELAEKLEFSHMIIHPGSFTKSMSSSERVAAIAEALEIILAGSSNIIFLLENSAHKDKSFSASIEEFGLLFDTIGNDNRVKMCIDTAHAYVAGYDMTDTVQLDTLIRLLIDSIGIHNIGLLHCNDTKKACGSFVDHHAVPGHGNIGIEALYNFVHHPQFAHIPVIFEMPQLDESLEFEIIQQFTDMEILPL